MVACERKVVKAMIHRKKGLRRAIVLTLVALLPAVAVFHANASESRDPDSHAGEGGAVELVIQMEGNREVLAGDAMRYDISGVANPAETPLHSFYWRFTVPVGTVRLKTLHTGTWSRAQTFSVLCTTNLVPEWRIMEKDLNTDQSYSLDCTRATYALQKNEVIQEILVQFGTVEPGFSAVEPPSVVVQALPGLGDGAPVTAQCDVGVHQGGEWVQVERTWTTAVIARG